MSINIVNDNGVFNVTISDQTDLAKDLVISQPVLKPASRLTISNVQIEGPAAFDGLVVAAKREADAIQRFGVFNKEYEDLPSCEGKVNVCNELRIIGESGLSMATAAFLALGFKS